MKKNVGFLYNKIISKSKSLPVNSKKFFPVKIIVKQMKCNYIQLKKKNNQIISFAY